MSYEIQAHKVHETICIVSFASMTPYHLVVKLILVSISDHGCLSHHQTLSIFIDPQAYSINACMYATA